MNIKGITSLTGYAVLVSSIGFFARYVEGLDLLTIVFFRALIGAIFVLAYTLLTGSLRELRPNNILGIGLVALFQGSMMICFIGAVLYTTIANAVFITYTAPVFAILFSWLFLGEKISKATIFSFVLTGIGVGCIVDFQSFSLGAETMAGDLMALGAGLSYAAVTITSKSLSKTNSDQTVVFWQMGLVALALIPFINLPSPAVLLSAAMPLAGLGVVATGFSFLLFMSGVRHVAGQHVLIITSLEAIIPAGFAWLIFGEALSSTMLAACAMIIAGVIWVQLADLGRTPEITDDLQTAPTLGMKPVSVS